MKHLNRSQNNTYSEQREPDASAGGDGVMDGDLVQLLRPCNWILTTRELEKFANKATDSLSAFELNIVDWIGARIDDHVNHTKICTITDSTEKSAKALTEHVLITLGTLATDVTETLHNEMSPIPTNKEKT